MTIDSTILTALIALFGTVLTVYVGYRQWKHHRDTTYLPVFQNDRQIAYKTLWDLLPDPSTLYERENIRAETEGFAFNFFSESELNETRHKVEIHTQKSIVYIDGKDAELADQYIAGLLRVRHIFTAIESRSKKKLEALDAKGRKYREKHPLPPTGLEKTPAIVALFHHISYELADKFEYLQYKSRLKSLEYPYSFWPIFAIVLSPGAGKDIELERKARAFMKLAKKARRKLVTRYRNILSGRE